MTRFGISGAAAAPSTADKGIVAPVAAEQQAAFSTIVERAASLLEPYRKSLVAMSPANLSGP